MIRASLLFALLLPGLALAETHRLAIVVGNNIGAADQPTLHYAESDAGKFGDTLVELGHVAPEDLYLLQGKPLTSLEATFSRVRDKVQRWRASSAHVVLLFFFSGHSDGEALELRHDRLLFADLRRWLAGLGANVRVAILDSCRSGAMLAIKGGRLTPAFSIRISDDVASTGEALLTSSASDELALESSEIRGSFFTHYLISGLRGAADTSGDGLVTLAEAYQYAYVHTVSTTASTTIGPQHPTYDYRLSGQGDVMLSDLGQRTAAIDLPAGFDRIVVNDSLRDRVLAEAPAGSRLALPPGSYEVRAWRDRQPMMARVRVDAGEIRQLRAEELQPWSAPAGIVKGGSSSTAQRLSFTAAGGVEAGVASGTRVHGGIQLSVGGAGTSGWIASARVSTADGAGFWETSAFALAGYRLGFERGVFRGFAGLEGGAGLVSQDLDRGAARRTAALAGAPELGAAVRIGPSTALVAEAQLLVGWMRQDSGNAALISPAGWIGLAWSR